MPGQEDEEDIDADDFDNILGDWGVKSDKPLPTDKGKKKAVAAEGSKKRSKGQKRKVEGGVDDDMEVNSGEGTGTKEQRKKVKLEAEKKDVDEADPDYDFAAMGVQATDPIPRIRTPCLQCSDN